MLTHDPMNGSVTPKRDSDISDFVQKARQFLDKYNDANRDVARIVEKSAESILASKRVLAAAERLIQNIYS